jgi:hypothetical protein
VDLIAEFCLIFILMKISANFVYYYTSYVVCYKNCRCFFLSIKKDRVKKNVYESFLLLWIWIRIRILNADPDPATKLNVDPDPKPCILHIFNICRSQ